MKVDCNSLLHLALNKDINNQKEENNRWVGYTDTNCTKAPLQNELFIPSTLRVHLQGEPGHCRACGGNPFGPTAGEWRLSSIDINTFYNFHVFTVILYRLAQRVITEWAHLGLPWTSLTAWTTLVWGQACLWGVWTATMDMATNLPMSLHIRWIR